MTETSPLDLTSLDTYRESCLEIARRRLSGFSSIAEIAEAETELNAYPNLDRLAEPRDVKLLDAENVPSADLDRARRAVLDGRIFWEHTAAGEATRLKMGAKYLIYPPRDLMPLEKIAEMMTEDLRRPISPGEVAAALDARPDRLLPINLGSRHLLQHAFDLTRLAEEAGRDPAKVLARQKVLLVLNEATAAEIIDGIRQADFMGFARENFWFMIQPAFHGIGLDRGRFVFDPASPRLLHNHGQLVLQETMDRQIFRLGDDGRRDYLTWNDFSDLLEAALDKVSYNIEDMDYLTGSLDWPSLALALRLGAEGCNMVMEVVANNPDHPIKGGMAAWDEVLGRDVMIESFQLKGLPNEEIKFLNKNFNHYTNPGAAWSALKEKCLPMPVAVKHGFLYFQPVQGDVNFLVRTAFVRRKELKPIRAWKSASNTIDAVNAMKAQDGQPGFKAFAASLLGNTV